MPDDPGPTPSRVLQRVGSLLVKAEGGFHFPPEAETKIEILVEVAARLKDEDKGAAALLDLVRLSLALERGGQTAPAETLRSAIKKSAAALHLLERIQKKHAASFERFQPSHGSDTPRRAPRFDEASDQGVPLKDLLPAGSGRKLERPRRDPPGRPPEAS